MSELKAETIVPQGSAITLQMYPKGEADAALAAKDNEIAELKHSLELATKECCDISESETKEKRRLKRALWLARAISAINAVGAIHNVIVCMQERNPKMSLSNIEAQKQVWKNVARKCRAMAEKFK